MDDSGALGVIVGIVVALALAAVGGGVYLYATDYKMTADVKDTSCGGPIVPDVQNVVAIKTRTLGIDHDVKGIPDQQCLLLVEGDYVEYHIRTKHTTLYRSNGACVYDTEKGTACAGLV
ncbi:MAG: hypothetical protein WC876_05700 [Candidatus Thermoplasmatota archaeon]